VVVAHESSLNDVSTSSRTFSTIGRPEGEIRLTADGGTLAGMGVIYKPFGIILGILAGLLGKRIFNFVWTKIDDEDPPKATTEQTSWAKLLSSAAVQGVIFKLTRVVVDRYGAIGFSYLTGTWPGEKRPDPDE
jgi:hypothetical protein